MDLLQLQSHYLHKKIMKKIHFTYKIRLIFLFFFISILNIVGQVGINTVTPDPSSVLDVTSQTQGLLVPRMSQDQRNQISNPANGLLLFNNTTNTLDINITSSWKSIATNPNSNLVQVYSLADLPVPTGIIITLNPSKMYIFSGFVNISPYCLNLNGASLRGIDPGKDGIISNVAGGILRSTNVNVFIQDLSVIPYSSATKAYDLIGSSQQFCNLFSGSSVVEIGVVSLGVGQISGFKAITILNNYWKCQDGLKITGNVGKFCSSFSFISEVPGIGIEILAAASIDDVDLANNYFNQMGTGIKVNSGATIDRGRMTSNMFRTVSNYLNGFDSYSIAWEMSQNTGIPNSRAFAFISMNDNATVTPLSVLKTNYKILGTTITTNSKRFTTANNRLTYVGKDVITAKVTASIAAKSPSNNADFSIVVVKNGSVINSPFSSTAATTNSQSFSIVLNMELDLVTNDYIEVFIRTNNSNSTQIIVDEFQFRVTD